MDVSAVDDVSGQRRGSEKSELAVSAEDVESHGTTVGNASDVDVESVLLEVSELLCDPDSDLVDIAGDCRHCKTDVSDVGGLTVNSLSEVGVVDEHLRELGGA